MIRNIHIAALAGAAIVITAPAVAKPGGGGGPANVSTSVNTHANTNAGMNARVNSQGSMNASTNAMTRANTNSAVNANSTNTTVNANGAATNSKGPTHASPTGIAHANQNSVLARGSVQASTLPGLTTGLTVNNSSGTSIGTVSQIVTGTDGSIRLVIVTNDSGQTFRLAPDTLSISGGVVTTTMVTGG